MIRLADIDTKAPDGISKDEAKEALKEMADEIKELQTDLQASAKKSLLVVFQGMDASGKDGSSKKAFSECSPLGIRAYAFKKPTDEEFAHDFLWRAHKITPARGYIHIFNRSYYEDILIQRVHNWIDDEKRDRRMAAINAFEENLIYDNDTHILKFYMHLSRERQAEKLQARIDMPEDNWKHNSGDWEEAKLWDEYRACYEYAINNSKVPWVIAPCDQKWYRNYFIAKTVLETLKGMNLVRPTLNVS